MNNSVIQKIKKLIKSVTYILSWTLFALLIIIICLLVYYLISTNLYAKKGEAYAPKFSLYTIVSPSMEPTINVYDVIITAKTEPKDIKNNDIITFISTSSISNGMTVTHRVVSILKGAAGYEYKTKGDNNLSADTDTAKEENLLGKVVFKIPQLGRLQFFLSSKGGWLLVIIFPALYIIVNDIFKILKLKETKKKIEAADKPLLKEDKLKLEAFKKEEIKNRIDQKNIERAEELKEKLKTQNKVEAPVIEESIKVEEVKEQDLDNLQSNIFDEVEENNIFTEETTSQVEDNEKEEVKIEEKKELPNGLELPKLK